MSISSVFIYNKSRVFDFIKLIFLPVLFYILVRISVVGFRNIAQSAPVDFLSFGERMIMIPSMVMFYIGKFLFPRDLATSYYWTYKTFTLEGFFIPAIMIILIIAGLVFAGFQIYKKGDKRPFNMYLFFAAWTVLGLAPHMQIIALDMTACETWFIMVMTGVIGMITVIIRTLFPRIKPSFLLAFGIILLIIL